MERILSVTSDGSHTLFVPEIDECYHSRNGAVQESEYIFLERAFRECPLPSVCVFEVGFGTGLNAFRTLLEAERTGRTVHYTSAERYPVPLEQVAALNYADGGMRDAFLSLHRAAWNEDVPVSDRFCLHKWLCDFTQAEIPGKYDVVYFDAFSPEKQPKMWDEQVFARIFSAMSKGGILTTYCAKGCVRRTLQKVGFTVERLPGPPGKREILRARK